MIDQPSYHRNVRTIQKRTGFSLLEILLALAILGGALAILSQIMSTGAIAAREARDLSTARILCQAKLSEIMLEAASGVSPQGLPATPIESFDSQSVSQFVQTVEVETGSLDGMLNVRVTIESLDPDGGPPLARYALTRWMIDPLLGLEEAEQEEKAAKEESASGAAAT